MWRKIRSNYLLKEILNYVGDKRKLNLIKYNKAIQVIAKLNLIDFRRFSGRYIKEECGRIEVYNSYNNHLIFEGEYSNGKIFRRGKEYNEEGKLIFEGEYLNDKKWKGIEKEYDEDTEKLIFECEYANGERNGKGKEYDKYNGELLFSGTYLNGKRNGKGEEYKFIPCKKSIYEQSYFSYLSKLDSKNIIIFSGEYLNGERKEGSEYNYDEHLVYEGGFLNGKKSGNGKLYNDKDRIKYEGEFVNGKKMEKG